MYSSRRMWPSRVRRRDGEHTFERNGIMQAADSVLPSPLWGAKRRGGGRGCVASCVLQLLPPPPTPPHKGEGSTPSFPRDDAHALINRALALRGIEGESRNVDVELFAGRRHHSVGSRHETGRRRQRNAAGIFEILARLEHRLFPDHAGTAHLLQAAVRVGDAPMTCFELD